MIVTVSQNHMRFFEAQKALMTTNMIPPLIHAALPLPGSPR